MLNINARNIDLWRKSSATVLSICSLVLLAGVVGEPDERFQAMLDTREDYFQLQSSLVMAVFELALLVGMIVALWVGSTWYIFFFLVESGYYIVLVDIGGPFLTLGVADAVLSALVSISGSVGAALVLMRLTDCQHTHDYQDTHN